MKLTEKQIKVLEAEGHVIVTGGPGSGKTTISILKAAGIAETKLNTAQKVLFLSFARATVSRVIEAIEHEQKIPEAQKRQIEVDTYHAFFWRILKTCSGQPIPDTMLSFSSTTAGASPWLN